MSWEGRRAHRCGPSPLRGPLFSLCIMFVIQEVGKEVVRDRLKGLPQDSSWLVVDPSSITGLWAPEHTKLPSATCSPTWLPLFAWRGRGRSGLFSFSGMTLVADRSVIMELHAESGRALALALLIIAGMTLVPISYEQQ